MAELSTVKILIAEDESIIALDIKNIIRNFGYHLIFIAYSAKEAIVYVEKEKPDLILMDIMMENGMAGIEAAQIINKKSKIPIIFITASTDKFTLSEALKTNPVDILIKPFSDTHLKKTIEKALEIDSSD